MGEPPAIFRWLTPGPVFLGLLASAYLLLFLVRHGVNRRWGPDVWNHRTRTAEGWLLTFLLFGAILLSTLQIILRNLFDIGLLWIDPLLRYSVLWVGLLGAFVATRSLRHITIDIVGRMLPDHVRPGVRILTSTVSLVACALLANASWAYLEGEVVFGSEPFLGVPSWLASSVLVFGFAGMGWRFLGWMLWPRAGGPGREPKEEKPA
ncbi:MAG: TRAP transporter small permease subunit [Candidatus Eisenbacteria bacterium]|nr:TRAP transporter small permease subunit [Candidatus Eisenbacteria bacterium]